MEKNTFRRIISTSGITFALMIAAVAHTGYAQLPLKGIHGFVTADQDTRHRVIRPMPQTFHGVTAKLPPANVRNKNNMQEQILVDEDFSKFTAGTEDNPSTEMVNVSASDWTIPDNYTRQPGWTGMGVLQAGGICALTYPNYGGCINTPTGDYSGSIHIKFRAKATSQNEGDEVNLTVGLAYNAAGVEIAHENVKVKKGVWTDYDLTLTCVYGGTDAYVQFNAYDYILIDDVKVSKVQNSLAEPALRQPTNFTYDGFTANWDKVGGATDYLLTVYKQVPTEDVDSVISDEDFTSFTTSAPEGWTYIKGKDSHNTIFSNAEMGVDKALYLEDGDTIVTPDNGGMFISLQMDIIAAQLPGEDEGLSGRLTMDGWDGYKWKRLGYTYSDFFYKRAVQRFDFSSAVAGKYYKFRISASGFGTDIAFAIDNVHRTTTPPTKREYLLQEQPVDTTSYTLTGLDPEADYFYTVRARNAESGIISGEPTSCMDAFGVAAPKVQPATDIDSKGEYTAHWEAAPKATSYQVNNYDVYTASKVVKDYVVLKEDFSKLDGVPYTPQAPQQLGNSSLTLMDAYCDNLGWYGYFSGIADGALGAVGVPQYGIGGQIQSPELSLNNDGGTFHIKLSACGQYEGENLQVYALNGKNGISCPLTTDYQTFEGDIEGGTLDDILVFASERNTPFFISSVEVTQNLQPGDKVYHLIETAVETGKEATSHRFTKLKNEADHSYAYNCYSIYKRFFDTAYSTASQRVAVDLNTTTVRTVNGTSARPAQEVARYATDGRRIAKGTKGMNIIKYTDGTVRKVLIK